MEQGCQWGQDVVKSEKENNDIRKLPMENVLVDLIF